MQLTELSRQEVPRIRLQAHLLSVIRKLISLLEYQGKIQNNIFFSLIVFGGTEVPVVNILLCRPLEDSLQGSAIPDGSPSKDWQSTVGWGDAGFEPRTAVLQSGVATNEPPLLP
jgi:hypothetical protein